MSNCEVLPWISDKKSPKWVSGGLTALSHSLDVGENLLQSDFHEMFRVFSESEKKRTENKLKKKSGHLKERRRIKNDTSELEVHHAPFIEIRSNPSSFAVFTNIRHCILEKRIRDAACHYFWFSRNKTFDSESEDEEEKSKEEALRVPKIIALGLCGVFELIKESRHRYPQFCIRVLQSLLDMLQGQQPEGLKSEPSDIIDKLFDLLLDIATVVNPATDPSHADLPITAYACACLLSLVIARGDTGKLLCAASSLLMSPRLLAVEEIPTPGIIIALQKSVQAVLLGKLLRPDWLTHGIPKSAHCDTFHLSLPEGNVDHYSSLSCDGKYLYILYGGILYKVGSGFGGTVRGQIITSIPAKSYRWLGCAKDYIYCLVSSNLDQKFVRIEPDSLKEKECFSLNESGPQACFTDGEYLGQISPSKDDSFIIRTYLPSSSPLVCVHEINLKLAQKCLSVFGSGLFSEESETYTINLGTEDEPASVACGKDFAIVRTTSGKILYTGKSQSLGIKQGGPSSGKWMELPVTKSPKIVQYSVGHEGLHALLVSEDGSAFFVGLARRGEDGDQSKGRRQPKPVKPKKLIKMEGQHLINSACNNGTSAVITKEGELYLFGKDATHADHSTGMVTDLKGIHITQVALGKAHILALSNTGHVYTFGINHKGQCGRDFVHAGSGREAILLPLAMGTTNEDENEDEDLESEDQDTMCPPGKHRWKHDHCMVCTICGECTGYGASCIASGRPDRNPGLACGCGAGDSGCAECGSCRACAREEDQEAELAAWGQLAAGGILDNKQADIIIFDMRYGGRAGARLEDRLRRRIEEYRIHHRRKQVLHALKTVKGCSAVFRNSSRPESQEKGVVVNIDDPIGSDHEREASKLTSLPPARLYLPRESSVTQIACGMHHSVILLQNGEVYTFGSNQHGQLGQGDLVLRGAPTQVLVSSPVIQVAAGSNHTVLLAGSGQVYTFGSFQKGQLGRSPSTVPEEGVLKDKCQEKELPWYAVPGIMPHIGVKHGRRATWIGASGDHTFVKIDESLINAHCLMNCSVIANKSCIGIIPKDVEQLSPFRCLIINKYDGSCKSFSSPDQADLKEYATSFDSIYNILWSFNSTTQEISYYNIILSEACHLQTSAVATQSSSNASFPTIFSPELLLPLTVGYPITRSHAAIHLLGCLDILTAAQEQNIRVQDSEKSRQSLSKVYSKEDFSIVNRFESHGGGWGYSGHSIEAIRFMADTDILLGGFGLFGGRGEYTAKLKLFDIGPEGGDQETDGELLSETEEIPYECGARHKFPMLFDEPVPLQANRWYVAWARISGPSSDCGSSGQSVVTTEDQVVFYFKSSKKSNNGTDVNAGQLPQLLYRVITHDVQTSCQSSDPTEPISVLSSAFSRTVTPECFSSLLKLLRWSWQTFKAGLCDFVESTTPPATAVLLDMGRLMYICASSLHLLSIYINDVYPSNSLLKKVTPETQKMAECIVETRALLCHILADPVPLDILRPYETLKPFAEMLQTLLEECDRTFLTCYHTFYPSTVLKWRTLCDLLQTVDAVMLPCTEDTIKSDRLLAAVLASLCSPSVQLTSLLPINLDQEIPADETAQSSPDTGPNTPASTSGHLQDMAVRGNASDSTLRYPLLVECITLRTEREGCHSKPYSFREVLDRLLNIVVHPVQSLLRHEPEKHSHKLVSSTCAFLAAIVAELSLQTAGNMLDIHATTRQTLHATPSRFTRVSQNRTWNTGNGSPDAICISVDRTGVLIAGVCVYGGVGNEWHYELELLDDQSGSSSDPSHTQRWKTLEIVRGTYGPEDCYADVAELKFDRPVPIRENVKYAIRLRNHGARTNNGDGGLTQVKGPDGTTFTFSDCSLSFNGTNHTRGQIPQILYYSFYHTTLLDSEHQQSKRDLAELQARRNAMSICSTVIKVSAQLLTEAAAEEDESILEGISSSHLMTRLLPLILAHLNPIAASDARSAVEVMELVQKLMKWVALLNKRSCKSNLYAPVDQQESLCTTSSHYAVVESDHPYKPATVSVYKVAFPSSVRWMSLEFDPRCGTAQAEDTLQLYVPNKGRSILHNTHQQNEQRPKEEEEEPSTPYWPVLKKFSGFLDWPSSAVILPGSEVVFSLETASDYVKDDKANFYGFRCQVTGYEGSTPTGGGSLKGLRHLEKELAYLGGTCAASLLRRDLILPPVSVSEMEEDLDLVEDLAHQVFTTHSALLSQGIALAHPPTIQQALEGVLPLSIQSNERPFLKDFVACNSGTSGGRLARWLQPESYVDPKQCELICSQEELKCGWPSVITVITKDQYSKVVYVPNLKVEVRAVPMNAYDKDGVKNSSCRMAKVSKSEDGNLAFGGHPPPSLEAPYEVTVKDKMFYYAITLMKAYEDYSFEELRYVSPTKKRLIENMLVRTNNDGTYTANWTPGSVGWYLLHAVIDGFEIGNSQCHLVEVKEPPHGLVIPSKSLPFKSSCQTNKMRKFFAKFSSGLRIRSHPSLQSKQIGIIHLNGTVTFLDELHNDDGVWVRLSPETIKKYCHNGYSEAWCLQYNQHLGKTLLIPVEEQKSVLEEYFQDKLILKKTFDKQKEQQCIKKGPGLYHVIRCGASGHNIRSRPSLKAPPVGMLVLGNTVYATEAVSNNDGIWLKLDKESMQNYCFNTDGEAWSLAQGNSDIIYLQHDSEVMQAEESDEDRKQNFDVNFQDGVSFSNAVGNNVLGKGYDFASAVTASNSVASQAPLFGNLGQGIFTFGSGTSDQEGGSSGSASPFVFGSPISTPSTSMNTLAETEKTETDRSEKESSTSAGTRAVLQRWLREENSQSVSLPDHPSDVVRNIPPELQGVSVKELVKALGDSHSNGNSNTPPNTPPRRSSRSTSPKSGRSSSNPVPIPYSDTNSSVMNKTYGISPRVVQCIQQENWETTSSSSKSSSPPRRSSIQSEGSVSSHIGSILRELSHSSATGCIGCITQRNTISPISTPGTPGTPKKEIPSNQGTKSFTQTGTQTSPDNSLKSHFSIGSKEESPRLSPKMLRKDRVARQLRTKRDRGHSPVPHEKPSKDKGTSSKEAVREALSPSVAECLRAVFAAFLWHEGIVHDAMACASFLKFNPNLPKHVAKTGQAKKTVRLTKEQKARFRHSVEVTSPSLLQLHQSSSENIAHHPLNENINMASNRKAFAACEETSIPDLNSDDTSVTKAVQVVSDLPEALQHLVFLWEQISSACVHAIGQQLILSSPLIGSKTFQKLEKMRSDKRKVRKKKEYHSVVTSRGNMFGDSTGGPFGSIERETVCELCGAFYPHPVTYHMRQAHPGCGDHAGGKGYNSGGNFCGGWAGNCGDGGIGSSSWYLICDRCREKYLRQKHQSVAREKARKTIHKKSTPTKLLSPLPVLEVHQNMKQNALFLLELASAATGSHSRSSQGLPSLIESDSFNSVNSFQCLEMLGVQQQFKNMIGEEYFFLNEGSIESLKNGDYNNSSVINGNTEASAEKSGGESRASGEPSGRAFHRSVSVGLTLLDWTKQDTEVNSEGQVFVPRKRNNSSGSEGMSTLLCQPSAALTKLIVMATEKPSMTVNFILQRSVMLFILQRHDLDSLQLAIKQAVRKASCRVYAMQAFNWLLRSVTQPASLHDLLWCFVAAMSSASSSSRIEEEFAEGEIPKKKDTEVDREINVCEHPLSDITIAGEACFPLQQMFHTLLQTISDLMMFLPSGSALQQIAMQCWCLRFQPSDHNFLHRSHVFSNISKILSRSEEEDDGVGAGNNPQVGRTFHDKITSSIEILKDLTSLTEIKASSRQAMISSLTDSSTETFWESGDEDRNKTKVLQLTCASPARPKIICVHIDNCRDLGNKVSNIIFKSGPSLEEIHKLKQVEIESRYTGWINCILLDSSNCVIRLELKGPDNTLRLRQLKVLGHMANEVFQVPSLLSSYQIQQKNCETETLRVFRLLTSQVFGKLITGDSEALEDVPLEGSSMEGTSNDLKEHMVGILFSRSKLTHLQKQVCSHIVAAIKKEASRVREEWEASLCSKSQSVTELPKSSDAYCFEMLSMVLALSGSSVGRAYLSQQAGLLQDIFSLLHTGSARVQRQVTSLLRRVLPEVAPPLLASILGVPSLPPTDFSIVTEASKVSLDSEAPFQVHRMGILDVFLACIAKALTVQTKVKGSTGNSKNIVTVTLATSIHPRDFVGSRWWLRGCIARKLAEVIIQLLKDMASGKLTEAWARVTKGAIAENILNLTKMEEQYRTPSECLRTPTLWLALASLCVLDQDHVERLSSGQWVRKTDGPQTIPRPTCDNHDDGDTLAIILCNVCGNLCADCDRFLHLHRKTKSHQRQVFKEEEEAIKVDLHEGCGRTKLFWVMALADSKTLKAMVEFREGARGKSTTSTGVCRFCGATGNTGLLAIGNVCSEAECQEHARNACLKVLPCGHVCGGVYNENPCLPCLHGCSGSGLKQDADDMCMICFSEALACAPAIQLHCGHVFHYHCCREVLTKKWSGPRITFGFSLCPICKMQMEHNFLKDLLEPIKLLYEDVKRKALMRLEYEGLHRADAITAVGARYHNDPTTFAMERYAYYVCYKCKKAYYGGEVRCEAEIGPVDDYDPTELVCGACSDVSRAQMCPKHGTDFLEYKCRYCCSVAVFFCFGTTHFCNACHDDFQRVTNIPKHELPHCPAGPKAKQQEGDECPLHIKHPPTGEEFALGCGVCRNAHTF